MRASLCSLPCTTQVWETWPRGRRHSPAKGASGPKPGSRVRIPPSPPVNGGGTPEDRGLPGFCFLGVLQGLPRSHALTTASRLASQPASQGSGVMPCSLSCRGAIAVSVRISLQACLRLPGRTSVRTYAWWSFLRRWWRQFSMPQTNDPACDPVSRVPRCAGASARGWPPLPAGRPAACRSASGARGSVARRVAVHRLAVFQEPAPTAAAARIGIAGRTVRIPAEARAQDARVSPHRDADQDPT